MASALKGNNSVITGNSTFSNGNITFVNVPLISTDSQGKGGLRFMSGGANNFGYIEFRSPNTADPRMGYIGYGSSANTLDIKGEAATFNFLGNTPTINGNPILTSSSTTTFTYVAPKLTDINTQTAVVLAAVDFVATGYKCNLWGTCWFNHGTTAGDVYMINWVDIVDKTAGNAGVASGQNMLCYLKSGYSGIQGVTPMLAVNNLTIGHTYTARVWVQRNAAYGPTECNIAVGGICV